MYIRRIWNSYLFRILVGLLSVYLLMLYFRDARLMAQMSACQRRMYAFGNGLSLYAADYDDRLPPAQTWMDVTTPYVLRSASANSSGFDPNKLTIKNVYHCPALSNQDAVGYAFNSSLAMQFRSQIRAPEEVTVLYESQQLQRNAYSSHPDQDWSFRHGRGNWSGGYMLHMNGQVKFLSEPTRQKQ